MDHRFSKKFPGLYRNLDIIGFRTMDKTDTGDFSRKFLTYVFYFLLSILLEKHFQSLLV